MTNEQKDLYKRIKAKAKDRGVKTVDELQDLIADEFDDDGVTGADFEFIKDSLRLKRF
jgi:hypothetical protein